MSRYTRYYADGSHKSLNEAGVKAEYGTPEDWRAYNEAFRFGCALFVDGVCVYKGMGYHTDAALEKYAAQEKEMMMDGPPSQPKAEFARALY